MADVGIKFDAEGYSEFKKNLKDCQDNLRVMGSSLKEVKSQFDKNNTSVEALTKKNEALDRSIQEQKKEVDLLAKGVKSATDEWGANDKRTQDLIIKYNNAKTALNKLTLEYDANAKAIDGVGDEAKQTAEQLDKAGKSGSVFGDVLKANLASDAIKKSLSLFTEGLKEVSRQLKDAVISTSEYGSEINDTTEKVGISAEEYQKWNYAAKLCGVESDKLTNLMGKQQKTFADAKDGSKTAAEAYQRLGIDISKLTSSGGAFNAVMKKLASMDDATERNALANDIFGKSYADLNPLLAEGADGMEDLRKKAVKLGIVMSDEAVKAADDFGDSLDTLKAAFGGLKNNLSAVFLPGITEIMNGMTQVMTGDVDEGVAAIEKGITDFGTQIEQMGPYAKQALDLVVKVISDNLPSVVSCAGQVIVSLVNGLAQEMPELIPTAVSAITIIVQTLTAPDNLSPMVDGAVAIITSLAIALIEALPQLIDQIPRIINGIKNALCNPDTREKMKEAGRGIMRAFWDGMIDIWGGIRDWANEKADWINWKLGGYGSAGGGFGSGGTDNLYKWNGSHANGLDYVPFDGYIAQLHKGEMVVPAALAESLRGTSTRGFSGGNSFAQAQQIGTMNNQMSAIASYLPQILSKMDMNIVLDDGTLVGKLAPAMNDQIGRINTWGARGR